MPKLDPSSLKQQRKSAGLTQAELAKRSQVPYSTLTKLEQGHIPSPSVSTVQHLADALGCSVADLLTTSTLAIGASDKVRFVYFDIGGVLVHWLPSVHAYAERINRPYEQVLKLFYEYMGPMNRGALDFEDFQLLCLIKLKLDTSDEGRQAAMQSWIDDMRPVLPAHTFIDGITKRYSTGLLSNIGRGAYPEFVRRKLVPNLKYKTVVKSCDLGILKPDPAMFDVATQAARVRPEEVLFIDDSRVNVRAAREFGWQAEWFDEYHPQASIQRIIKQHFSVS